MDDVGGAVWVLIFLAEHMGIRETGPFWDIFLYGCKRRNPSLKVTFKNRS